ncbi:MAG: methyl-accepting chemotaxis protein [Planctomycetota bacterium]|jgi:methyl-accepting chemotaxis protein
MASNTKKISLSLKMGLGFGVPLLMIVALVVTIFVMANGLQSNSELTKANVDEAAKFAGIARQMKLDAVQIQQWLTDISATRAQDGLDDGFDEAENSYQSFLSGLDEFKTMFERENDSTSLQEVENLRTALNPYYEAGKKMAQAYIDGGSEAGNKTMGQFDQAASNMSSNMDPFVTSQMGELETAMSTIVSSTGTLRNTVLFIGIVAFILGTFLAWFITRSITKPINNIIAGLTDGAEQVSSASGQVSAASQSLAEGSTEQAAGLEETSSSLEEMASMTKQNADNAQQANTLASEARKAADTGTESMTRMNEAINDIQKSSDETAKIIKVIDEIAFQTNLLALNAAVEAARAGEAGKGFAVVAEEVRNLAMRSAEAAKNTSAMIEESVKNSKNGVDIATEVAKVLEEIVQSVGKTTDLVGEIAAASQEQAQGIDQVNTAMAQMDKVTQQNAANAEESASASEELSAQAESMNDVVGELMNLVGGSSTGQRKSSNRHHRKSNANHGAAHKTHELSSKNHGFKKSDQAFHKIADGQAKEQQTARPAPKQVAGTSAPEKVIPLKGDENTGTDDFKEFNG